MHQLPIVSSSYKFIERRELTFFSAAYIDPFRTDSDIPFCMTSSDTQFCTEIPAIEKPCQLGLKLVQYESLAFTLQVV